MTGIGSNPDVSSGCASGQFVTLCMDRLLIASEILQDFGSRSYVSGLFDRLAGRGLDGSTHAPLVSLADRLLPTIWVIRLWVRI